MGTTRPPALSTDSAATALFGETRQAVLGFFFDHPDERFYQRQVVRALDMGSGAVQRELARLTAGGILTRTVEGRQAYYQADREGVIFPELHGLVRKTMGVTGVLRTALLPLAQRIRIAFVYGSMASGQERGESDVDVMIVGDDISLSIVAPLLRPARGALRREINPTTYRTEEFGRKLAQRHAFVTRVVDGPKVFVVGTQGDLDRLAQRRTDQARSPGQGRTR